MGGDRQIVTGRTDNAVKNYWYSSVRKNQRRWQKDCQDGRPPPGALVAQTPTGPIVAAPPPTDAKSAPPQPQPPAGPFFVVPYAVPIPGQPNAAPPPPQGLIPSPGGVVPPGYVVRQMPQGYYVATPPNLAYAPGSPSGTAALGARSPPLLGSPVPAPVAAALGAWGEPRSAANQETEDRRSCVSQKLVEGPVLRFVSASPAHFARPKSAPIPNTTPKFLLPTRAGHGDAREARRQTGTFGRAQSSSLRYYRPATFAGRCGRLAQRTGLTGGFGKESRFRGDTFSDT